MDKDRAQDCFSDFSPQAASLWAKTVQRDESRGYSTLITHMLDAGACARLLWSDWLPCAVADKICADFFLSFQGGSALIQWLAMTHDIGKATPAFQYKVANLAERVAQTGLYVPRKPLDSCKHGILSECILKRWLVVHGWDDKTASSIGSVVGAHHGATPSCIESKKRYDQISQTPRNARDCIGGNEQWLSVQNELLDWAWKTSGIDEFENELIASRPSITALVNLCGLVIMADWISSNCEYFPPDQGVPVLNQSASRAKAAWKKLALPNPWTVLHSSLSPNELLRKRFPRLPKGAAIRPVQSTLVDAVSQMNCPGILVVEAPMGEGKTEASLLAAELLMDKFNLGGLAYLLPTQATSNAMFSRVLSWMSCVPSEEGANSVRLAHGKAELNDEFSSLNEWRPYHDDGESYVVAHQWFRGAKMALLSSCVVGTVDQVLMAALRTKHVQLRQLGLAGKVVVIDEVHAYDAYMGTYLDRVLAWLGAQGVPVLLLSATLPPSKRSDFINAYYSLHMRNRAFEVPDVPREDGRQAYPLVTVAVPPDESSLLTDWRHDSSATKDNGMRSRRGHKRVACPIVSYHTCPSSSDLCRAVTIECMSDDEDVLVALLHRELAGGGCACVLRDTVRRAQNTYERLVEDGLCEVLLYHSRYLSVDRARRDKELLGMLGPGGHRPDRLVVVATQVIEQSLDIDFDFMVSDIAPVDILLQRMGRLHRYGGVDQGTRPPGLSSAKLVLTGVESWNDIPVFARGIACGSSGSGGVYEPALLLRTLSALRLDDMGARSRLTLPDDISFLVEAVYEDVPESVLNLPDSWQEALEEYQSQLTHNLESKVIRAKNYLLGLPSLLRPAKLDDLLSDGGCVGEEQGRACVRDGQDSLEVVLLQEIGGELRIPSWVDSDVRTLGNGSWQPDDVAARVAATCTVSLPQALANPRTMREVVALLEKRQNFSGWQESSWLRGKLPLVLDADGHTELEVDSRGYDISYDFERGLVVSRKEERGDCGKDCQF